MTLNAAYKMHRIHVESNTSEGAEENLVDEFNEWSRVHTLTILHSFDPIRKTNVLRNGKHVEKTYCIDFTFVYAEQDFTW